MAFENVNPMGGQTNIQTGDPQYQQLATAGYEQKQRPYYQQALKDMNASAANRGMLNSGMANQNQMGLQQSFVNDVGGFQQNAALRGADIAEENRRRQQERGWQVEDRNKMYQNWLDQSNMRRDDENRAQMGGILGTIGGAVGTAVGGPILGAVGNKAASWIGKQVANGSDQTSDQNMQDLQNPNGWQDISPNSPYGG